MELTAFLLFFCMMGVVSCTEPNHYSDVCSVPNDYSDILGMTPADVESGIIEGMLHVKSTGKKTLVGTNDVSAKALERPQMKVEFTYDFDLGRHEVICNDFNEMMKNVSGLKVDCPEDSVPAANVTFYDAVLYANAMSKKHGADTAYEYSSKELDAEKHCVKMKNFKFNPKVDGFRLPTEAEWVFVASAAWSPKNSWNAYNSDNKVHKVCSLIDNATFCDMAGNMLELVNDWYGSFKDTTVANFVGSMDGDALGSCVVKGGSYYSAPTSVNLYNRGDTYPILSSTRGDYIGFRLAYGSIPEATWFLYNGNTVTVPVVPQIESSEIKKLTNSYQAKLVFRNDETGGLVYVNFAKNMGMYLIEDTVNVYHPEISPDGKHVAFCTSIEGSERESVVYVRDLNESGSNLVMLPDEHAAIPRWRVNPNGDTVIVYVSSAGNNKGEQFMQKSTWQVKFANGKFGVPEKLFDGAYHGGVSKDNLFAVSSSPLLRARLSDGKKRDDVIWYNGEQACNASLAKDGTNRTLFLDFGGSAGREFVGSGYGVHERLLVVDSTGQIIQTVVAPAGYTFDHTEWVGGLLKDSASNLVVATLTDANGSHHKVALVNLDNGDVVPLAEGEELWHPSLWIWQNSPNVPKPVVDFDSAGLYFDSDNEEVIGASTGFISEEMGIKMQSFWKNHDKASVFTFGSSMMLNAVIEDSIKSYKTVNMGISLTDIHLHDYLIRHYVLPYAPHVKYLVVELSPGFFYRHISFLSAPVLSTSPGIVYDSKHLSPETKNEIAELSQYQQFPKVLLGQQYIEGTFLLPSLNWGFPNVLADTTGMVFDDPSLQNNLNILKALKKTADSCGVKLIAAIPPRNPRFKDTKAFDPYGPSWDVAHQIIDAVKDMGIVIFDEYKDGHHDYTDAMAFNSSHVSYLGAAQFSARLDALLKSLE